MFHIFVALSIGKPIRQIWLVRSSRCIRHGKRSQVRVADGAQAPTQRVQLNARRGYRTCIIPHATAEVIPGVLWGKHEVFLTPAFWLVRARIHEEEIKAEGFRLGETLAEEVVACILGGYGMGAELGLAAFRRLRNSGAFEAPLEEEAIEFMLSQPLEVGGRLVRYRFPRQKARFVAHALKRCGELSHLADMKLRDALLALPGVGPKTASWITRNWCASDNVAILDVHVCRACEVAGVFPVGSEPARDYFSLEHRFLDFATAMGVPASTLDAVIWRTMRRLPHELRNGT